MGGVGGVTRIGLAGRQDELFGWGRHFMEEARRIDALPSLELRFGSRPGKVWHEL